PGNLPQPGPASAAGRLDGTVQRCRVAEQADHRRLPASLSRPRDVLGAERLQEIRIALVGLRRERGEPEGGDGAAEAGGSLEASARLDSLPPDVPGQVLRGGRLPEPGGLRPGEGEDPGQSPLLEGPADTDLSLPSHDPDLVVEAVSGPQDHPGGLV